MQRAILGLSKDESKVGSHIVVPLPSWEAKEPEPLMGGGKDSISGKDDKSLLGAGLPMAEGGTNSAGSQPDPY